MREEERFRWFIREMRKIRFEKGGKKWQGGMFGKISESEKEQNFKKYF